MHNGHLELSDIFRVGFERYCQEYGPLPLQHYRVARAIKNCHTAAMGGHVWQCEHCGGERISYNSCRNRHCPSCQAKARADWVDARTKELLPVPYFHVVFTLPAQLNPFALRNKECFYRILFAAVSRTLLELGRDPRRLGAELGFVALLHTWGQNVLDHPHVHCVVPGGGLDDDGWVPGRSEQYLLPVNVLAALFRGKFLALFREALERGEMLLHGSLERYRTHPALLRQLIDTLYGTDWVVYIKPPFAGPEAVVKYLGRYTHRIAIANSRLLSMTDTHVSFSYIDYADNDREKVLTLTITEFIRRFMLHVVPPGFVRIRYYGFLSCRSRRTKLQLCRDHLMVEPLECDDEQEQPDQPHGRAYKCPFCGNGHMERRHPIHKPDPGGIRANAA